MKVVLFTRTKTSTKASGTKENAMDMVFLQKEMVTILKVIGSMILEKDKVHTFIMIKISCLLESGSLTNLKLVFTQKLKMTMK